jgi:DNA-binding CsgD family transcriptional regulator/pimeloyl-ACP methyl ester carboxylesterase
MEPQIQYAKTSDGVDIAFATAGDGPPLVIAAPPLAHVQGRWEAFPHLYQPLAAQFHLVWYDSRGSGISDRESVDFSMEAMIRDLEAVVEAAGLTGFAMAALYDAVPIAVKYAAIRPEKILALVLADGWAKFSDYHQSPAYVAEKALRSGDWAVYTETFARVLIGLENQEFARHVAAYIRESIAAEAWRSANSSQGYEAWDVSAHLPDVTVNTLVVHNRNNRLLPVQTGQRLAASIPNARFQVVDDMDRVQLAGIIIAFLASCVQASPPAGLSRREAEVLRLVAAGRSNREIGEKLAISLNTVDRHVSNIYDKIGASNRAEAASFAVRNGIA